MLLPSRISDALAQKNFTRASLLLLVGTHVHQGLRLDTTAPDATQIFPFFPGKLCRHLVCDLDQYSFCSRIPLAFGLFENGFLSFNQVRISPFESSDIPIVAFHRSFPVTHCRRISRSVDVASLDVHRGR